MHCADPVSGVALLRKLGYYRFSAYAYPFRELLPQEAKRETSVQFRANSFVEGTTFENVAAIAAFDRGLRFLCLDALEAVELSLRVQLAYTLGARSTFGHLDVNALDRDSCGKPSREEGLSVYQSWMRRYERLQSDARSEDFVTHYVEKYDGRLPIWVAVEMMDFGSLVRLFGFLQQRDQSATARSLGVPNGRLFARMIKTLNYLRNLSAHHARLWNRSLTYQMPAIPQGMVDSLDHLAFLEPAARKKVYSSLVVLNHLVTLSRPELGWSSRMVAHLSTFPRLDRVGLVDDMGFPDDWRAQAPWTV
jgi:abortive infection bacteriophage resistance protein